MPRAKPLSGRTKIRLEREAKAIAAALAPNPKPKAGPKPKAPTTLTITEPNGYIRDKHPDLRTVNARVQYITEYIAQGRWYSKSVAEMAADWELSEATVRQMHAEAQRRLESHKQKDFVIQLIQERLSDWVKAGGRDRVKAAELLLKTVGALTEKHEVVHSMGDLSDEEVTEKAIEQLVNNAASRDMVRKALAAFDEGQKVNVQLLSSSPLPIMDEEQGEDPFDE